MIKKMTTLVLVLLPVCANAYGQTSSLRTDAETEMKKAFVGGDSFIKMNLKLLLDESDSQFLRLSIEQREQITALSSQLARWQGEEQQKLEDRHGERFRTDVVFRAKYRPLLSERVQQRWLKEIKDEILLDFQVKAIEKASVTKIRAKIGDEAFYSMPWVRKQLGIDDAQWEKISERIKLEKTELEKQLVEIAQEIEDLKKKALQDVLGELTPEQREKIESWFTIDKDHE